MQRVFVDEPIMTGLHAFDTAVAQKALNIFSTKT
jgi:hypothetical protein